MFLYNSQGTAIAYRRSVDDRWLWDTQGQWLGWFPWGDAEAYTKSGKYLGTVVGNRLFRRSNPTYRGYPGYPGYPGYAGYPGYGGYAGYCSIPSGFRDLDIFN
ncbi:MAG TPA: hypothetical protein VG650_04035 [Mycobacteriales bacterium]|nr:hypothetical protein [Mycobacteriales bacterium]